MAAPPPAAATAVELAWQPLGPFYMPHGQTYGSGRGSRPPVAGRVSSIAIDPGDDQHILCGAAGGGIWESKDGGLHWSARGDQLPSLSIGAIAFDQSDPQRVYAGTGEGDTAPSATGSVRAVGLIFSVNGGTDWSVLPDTPFDGISFYDLIVDPSNSQHLLAATTSGLYETTNGGTTWHRRRTKLTWALSMHAPVPTNPAVGQELLAACEDGIFRSTNGGTSWTSVSLPGRPANFQVERYAVAHSPSNGSVAYVSAAGSPEVTDPLDPDGTMPKPYLWRRSAFGGGFVSLTPPPHLQTGQAWYDWFLGVAPNNPDVVYVGGIDAHRGTRQSSGSWDWVDISAKNAPGQSIHPDQHAIAFSPQNANVVYIGNDGGIYRSPDAGVTWESLNKGLSITEIEFLAQHPEYDAWLLAGTQDNGTIRYEGQQTWYHVQDGDGGDCGVNRLDPYTCYHSFYGPYIGRSTVGGAWEAWHDCFVEDEKSLFYPPLDVDGKLVVRGATSIWISRNRGNNWTAVSLPGQTGYPSSLAIASDDQVYAGTTQGECYVLKRTGSNWSATKLTSPAAGYVSDIIVEPGNSGHLWCSVNADGVGAVYRSTDGGSSWAQSVGGLPIGVAIHAMEVDVADAALNTLFLATDVGVYRTLDGGASWHAFGRGLPNVLVKDLLLHPVTRLLRAGTQARGVWEIKLDELLMPDVHIYLRDHAADTGRKRPSATDVPNPFEKGAKLFWWQSPDIKVDSPPYLVPALSQLEFDSFSDDRSMKEGAIEFALGLRNDPPVRGQTVRVYVQAHNRGSETAKNVAVRVFFAAGSLTWPDLPAGFWSGFPNNAVPADSPWQPIASHHVIPEIATGRSAIAGFEWAVPSSVASAVALLAVISAENDSVEESSLVIADLARTSRYCALRNLAVVNPSPLAGPMMHAIIMDVVPDGAVARLDFDHNGARLIRGVVLSKAQAAAAKKAGWKSVKLTSADRATLAQLIDERPSLKRQISGAKTAYAPSKKTVLPINGSKPQSLVVLVDQKARPGSGSIILRGGDQSARGGMTLLKLAATS